MAERRRRSPASVCIVMPAYNEADGIGGFLAELSKAKEHRNLRIIVVDDASTDSTGDVVEAQAAQAPISLVRRPTNGGHGVATLTALRAGLASGCDLIVSVDGDGQCNVGDIERLVAIAEDTGAEVVEGCRRGRDEPIFRKAVSLLTRALVGIRAGLLPRDANTPNRAYRHGALERVLTFVPAESQIPNLWISLAVRKRRFCFLEAAIDARRRRGLSVVGTMWRSSHRSIPSRRFLYFCLLAAKEWLRPLPTNPHHDVRSVRAHLVPSQSSVVGETHGHDSTDGEKE